MKMKLKTEKDAEINITSLIDCMMMVIIFFMVIMSANYVFGVAIKFPAGGAAKPPQDRSKTHQEKSIVVYISKDQIGLDHFLIRDGIVKLNDEEIPLVVSDTAHKDQWPQEREKAWNYLRSQMNELIKKGYDKKALMIQGDMKTYHGRAMKVIDIGKDVGIDGFSLAPPAQ